MQCDSRQGKGWFHLSFINCRGKAGLDSARKSERAAAIEALDETGRRGGKQRQTADERGHAGKNEGRALDFRKRRLHLAPQFYRHPPWHPCCRRLSTQCEIPDRSG